MKEPGFHIFPLPPASKGAIGPGTTSRLRNGEAANSECRAEDEKSLAPCTNPRLPLFTLSVSWRKYAVLYILTSLRQAFCYLEPKVFLTDTAVRPGFQPGNPIPEPGSLTPFLPASLCLGLSWLWPHRPLSSSKPPCFYLPPNLCSSICLEESLLILQISAETSPPQGSPS